MNLKTLSSSQAGAMGRLGGIRAHGFFLAGGTAVALKYGHRMSEDFDLFRPAPFAPSDLFMRLSGELPGLRMEAADKNTIICSFDGVKLSFFGGVEDDFLPFEETEWFPVADMLDVACMKLWAMMNREVERDYADMYVIIRDHGVGDVLSRFRERHGGAVSDTVLLKAMAYFGGIEPGQVEYVEPGLDFEKVKAGITSAVTGYVRRRA